MIFDEITNVFFIYLTAAIVDFRSILVGIISQDQHVEYFQPILKFRQDDFLIFK